MIVFEPLASPGAASGDLRFSGFARQAARGAFGFLDFAGRASARTAGRAAGELRFDGAALRAVVGGRALGFFGFGGEARAKVPGVATGWLVFDRAAFVPEPVPTARGDLDFTLSGWGGYRRTQVNSPLGELRFDGGAQSTALRGVARGELRFEGVRQPVIDPEAANAFVIAQSRVSATLGVESDWLSEAVRFDESTRIDVSTLLVQRFRARSGLASSSEASASLDDTAVLSEAVQLTYRLLVAEGFLAGSTVTELRSAVERAQDGLVLTGVVESEAEAFSLLALAVLLGARTDALIRETLFDEARLGETLVQQIEQVASALSRLRASDTVVPTATIAVMVNDAFKVSDSCTSAAEAVAAITEALRFGIRLSIDSGDFTAWVLNTESKHLSSYTDFPINSFAEIGGRLYGACDDGIYLLDGDDDAGQPIAARARFALTTLGTGVQKRVPSAYLGYTATNDLLLQVIHTDEAGGKRAYTYRMKPSPSTAPVNGRVTFGRGVKSAYYGFQLTNVDGGMFDIDKMVVYPLALDRRINRS